MAILIETKRLVLKEMKLDDATDLFNMNNDPEVIRYTGDQSFKTLQEAVNFITDYQQYYQTYNCGRLSTFLKETGEYIGWCGLKYLINKDATDLGYRFTKKHWGKGYATEAAMACLHDGFTRIKLDKIIATAMLENTASINVFKKLGLKFIQNEDCGCQPGVVYAITKEEWK